MTPNAPLCLYCGYNLTGLQEASRCPECGMVSVPGALRQEVWHITDSPRRLWALMARPLVKHPPGWWWSLDRPGDVGRSVRALVRNLVLSLVISVSAVVAADAVVVEKTSVMRLYDQADPLAETRWWSRDVVLYRMFNDHDDGEHSSSDPEFWGGGEYQRVRSPAQRAHVVYRARWDWNPSALGRGAAAFAWLLLVWAYVAQVGLWTQIRKGLPDFASPPRSIIAAANLQSCKLVFLAVFVALGCVVEVAARWVCDGQWSPGYELVVYGVGAALAGAAGTVWAGALRSDFTRQLVRSPVHALRLISMYAVVLPALTIFALLLALRMGMLFN